MMSRNLLDYAKWYLEEDDYFISETGRLLYCYPPYTELKEVFGFRFYISLPYDTLIMPYDTGKPIAIVPRDIVPIDNQDDW